MDDVYAAISGIGAGVAALAALWSIVSAAQRARDPANGRWRVAPQREKGGHGRWVPVPADVFAAVDALVPREDRDLEAPVLPWLRQANLRREIARGAKATGTPLWSPHDLRHRRISLWHRAGVSWAQIGEWAGQRGLATTANRYTHVVVGREIDHAALLPADRVPPPVPHRRGECG